MKRKDIPANQTIRELLYDEFLIDLPISGGGGKSIADAIVLDVFDKNDYVGTEYLLLDLFCYYRKVEWKFRQQILFKAGSRKYDCIQIAVSDLMDGDQGIWTEAYYFDVTQCLGNADQTVDMK